MSDPPDRERGESWNPQFRDVDVVPADLSEFAQLVGGDHAALQAAGQAAVDDLPPGLPNLPGSTGPGDGMPEGAGFLRAYFLTLGAQLALLDDTLRGLATLRDGADRIHTAYLATDLGSQGTLESAFAGYDRAAVQAAFGPSPAADEGPGDE